MSLSKKISIWSCLTLLSVIALNGCNYLSGGSDNSEPPIKLSSITSVKDFKQLWAVNSGRGDAGHYLKLKPLVLDNRIVTVDSSGILQARDIKNGAMLWENKINYTITQGVAGDSNRVFVTTSLGEIIAFNALDGQELWRKKLAKNILNNPYSDSKVLYVQATDGTLYSLNSTSGDINWEYQVLVPDLTLYSTSSPLVWRNTVIAGFSNGKIVSFDNKTGMPNWDYQIADPIGQSSLQRMVDVSAEPLIIDNVLYAASYQGKVVALDLLNGQKLWEHNLSSITNMSTNNKYLYISDTEGKVWALNRHNGSVLWKQDNLYMRHLSGTNFLEHTVLVGDYDGYIHGLADDHGGFIARTKVANGSIRVAPVVKHGIIYILDNKGKLAAYRLGKSTA